MTQWLRPNPFNSQRGDLTTLVTTMEGAWSNGRSTDAYVDALTPVSEDAGIDIDDFVEALVDEREDYRPMQAVTRELYAQIDNASNPQIEQYIRHVRSRPVGPLLGAFGARRDPSSGPADHRVIFGNTLPSAGHVKQVAELLRIVDQKEQQWVKPEWSEHDDAYVVDFYTLHDPEE